MPPPNPSSPKNFEFLQIPRPIVVEVLWLHVPIAYTRGYASFIDLPL